MTNIQYKNNNESTMIFIVQYNNKNVSWHGYRDKLSCLKSTGDLKTLPCRSDIRRTQQNMKYTK